MAEGNEVSRSYEAPDEDKPLLPPWERGSGPIYDVPLLDSLPLGSGGMRQQLPSRDDLEGVKDYMQGQRVVAGYEVVLQTLYDMQDAAPEAHYRRCHNCGRFQMHVNAVAPWVCCRSCGSQDTRRIKQ